jgi:hypothetical protein
MIGAKAARRGQGLRTTFELVVVRSVITDRCSLSVLGDHNAVFSAGQRASRLRSAAHAAADEDGSALPGIRVAALTVLRGRSLPVPDLIAVADDPPLVVRQDLRDGPSLADALPGEGCRHGDAAAVRAWVDALAPIHAATAGDQSPHPIRLFMYTSPLART